MLSLSFGLRTCGSIGPEEFNGGSSFIRVGQQNYDF